MKLYNVPEDSAVGRLVNYIEYECEARDLVLRRFQTNNGRSCIVSWAILPQEHANVRYYWNSHDPQHSVPETCPGVSFAGPEGKTEKCRAWRELHRLAYQAGISLGD